MFNIKWGGICAGTAFVLALALSLILGQTSLLIALFRAVIFAALFFGLGIGTWLLIKTFLPELLSAETADIATHLFSTGTAGSRVNITVDDGQNAALPEQNNDGDVGDFNDLFSAKITAKDDSQDIDQTPATGYTGEGETGEFGSTGEFAAVGDFASTGGEFDSTFSDTGLQDENEGEDEPGEFSMDFSAFVPGGLGDGAEGGDDEAEEADGDIDSFSFFPEAAASSKSEEAAPERKAAGNKPMKLEGDFNAKEIAAGLRTVLEKDKK